MSYLVLARKWRPRTFGDLVGQQHVVRALSHALDNERLHHAYLFAGTRGVGKTTIARILAKALNCEAGVSSTPCGECSACVEIDEGRFVDLIEVDAASRTRVDDTRELLENVQYAPTRGRYKVYLIDEVHMLSTHSFNALLKTLEEPPPHVKFLLATTDPQKLPVTVLSRCLQFNLKRLTVELISGRLQEICEAEDIESESGALELLAQAADGSLRDSLSLMDQAIGFGDGRLPEADVREMLGVLDTRHVVRILGHLADGDGKAVLADIAEADEQFPDYARLLDEMSGLLKRIAVYHAVGETDLHGGDADTVADLAGRVTAEDAQLFYQTAILGKRDLRLAPDPRSGVEMTLLRMLAFRPAPVADAGTAAPGRAGGGAAAAGGRQATPAAAAAHGTEASPKTAAEAVAEPAADLADWHRLIGQLPIGGAARLLAANCALESHDGNRIALTLDKRSQSLLTDARRSELLNALAGHLGKDISLHISVDGVPQAETPVQREKREESERRREAHERIAADPAVKTLQRVFDAELQQDAPKPQDG